MVTKVKECLTADITKLVESEESSESILRDTPSTIENDQDEETRIRYGRVRQQVVHSQ